ncbi:hypothetical protein N665_0593s0031 [Sinapis alba]|nr:hypothetical protein N665_0593s0031 [Sinapis alba]
MQEIVRDLIPLVRRSHRPDIILRHRHIIKHLELNPRRHLLLPHLTNIMQHTASTKHVRKILQLNLRPLLQTSPTSFKPLERLNRDLLNPSDVLVESVLRPRQILPRVRD